jgi:hypothetical protein
MTMQRPSALARLRRHILEPPRKNFKQFRV